MAIGRFDAIVACRAIVFGCLKSQKSHSCVVLPGVATAFMCFRWLALGTTPACAWIPYVHNVLCFAYKCGAWYPWAHLVRIEFSSCPLRPKCARCWQVRMI